MAKSEQLIECGRFAYDSSGPWKTIRLLTATDPQGELQGMELDLYPECEDVEALIHIVQLDLESSTGEVFPNNIVANFGRVVQDSSGKRELEPIAAVPLRVGVLNGISMDNQPLSMPTEEGFEAKKNGQWLTHPLGIYHRFSRGMLRVDIQNRRKHPQINLQYVQPIVADHPTGKPELRLFTHHISVPSPIHDPFFHVEPDILSMKVSAEQVGNQLAQLGLGYELRRANLHEAQEFRRLLDRR